MTGKEKVLQLLEQSGKKGITDEDIASSLGMNPSSARTRRCELERDGLILPVGISQTKAGRRTFLWTAIAALNKETKWVY